MSNQFARTVLLLGQENVNKLKNCRVAVFGIGGVGGHCVEALCRCGIGTIDVFDGDVVDITNLNRQLIATHSVIGQDKVKIMQERLLEINPEVRVNAHKLFYLPETSDTIDLSVYDYIIDAVDTMTAKIELVCRATASNVPIISSMGAANKLDPTAFVVADIYKTSECPMARIMRRELRKRNIESLKVVYSKEKPHKHHPDTPQTQNADKALTTALSQSSSPRSNNTYPTPTSVSFVPPVSGLIMAGEVVKDLLKQ